MYLPTEAVIKNIRFLTKGILYLAVVMTLLCPAVPVAAGGVPAGDGAGCAMFTASLQEGRHIHLARRHVLPDGLELLHAAAGMMAEL